MPDKDGAYPLPKPATYKVVDVTKLGKS